MSRHPKDQRIDVAGFARIQPRHEPTSFHLNSCEFSYEDRVKTAHERTATDREIDALVYELYGLTDE